MVAEPPLLQDEVVVEEQPQAPGGDEVVAEPPLPPPELPPPEAGGEDVSAGEHVLRSIAAATRRYSEEEWKHCEENFTAVASVDELRWDHREKFESVKAKGMGICSRCRWLSGCQSCDVEKAWSWACRQTLWLRISEALKPAAKPKGRPKGSKTGAGLR